MADYDAGALQDIMQIDPLTGAVETLQMSGQKVVNTYGGVYYGRFRLIPGTDTVVLATMVSRDLMIGQLPVSGGLTPTPGLSTTKNASIGAQVSGANCVNAPLDGAALPGACSTPPATSSPVPVPALLPSTGQFLGATGED